MFPSAFPFSCKQRAHTKVVITGLEEWDKNSPFCSFSRTIRYCAFSSFLGSEKDYDRKQKGERDTKRMTKKRVTETEWETIYGGWQQRNERTKADPRINSITLIGNAFVNRLQDGRCQHIVLECLSGCQTIVTTRIYLSVPTVSMILMCSFKFIKINVTFIHGFPNTLIGCQLYMLKLVNI